MQYVQIKDNKILAMADWQFPDSIPAKEEVVKNEEGQLVFKSELNESHEESIRLERTKAEVRSKRNQLIAETDYLVTTDYPLTEDKLQAVKEYRKALRDITNQEGFPNNVIWPTNPMEA